MNNYGRAYAAQNGSIWISTQGDGVIKWNPVTNETNIHLATTKKDSIRAEAQVLIVDQNDNVLALRKSTLYFYNSETRNWIDFTTANPGFSDIIFANEDGLGRIWLVRKGSHCLIIDPHNPIGILDTSIALGDKDAPLYSLQKDDKGNMWGFYRSKIREITLQIMK
jgi:hypothetical protein